MDASKTVAVHLYADDGGLRQVYNLDTGAAVTQLTTHKFLFQLNDSPEKVVTTILKPIGFEDRIAILRVVAHGDAGGMLFPGLMAPHLVSPEWRRLRSWFRSFGSIELHGCGVASQTSILMPGVPANTPGIEGVKNGTFYGDSNGIGLRFLRAVAATFGVQVTGGIDFQVVTPNRWHFTHDTVTVFPSGKFHYENNEGRCMDTAAMEEAARSEFDLVKRDLFDKGKFPQAKQKFQLIVQNYPRTRTAEKARELILQCDHPKPAPPPMQPDSP